MLLFEYEKSGSAKYIPHVDLLRAMTRTFRRAGIEVKYSAGFNPHALVVFSPPLPVGTAGEAEECLVDTDMPAEEFVVKFNAAAPGGIRALRARVLTEKYNPASAVKSADYEAVVKFSGTAPDISAAVSDIIKSDSLVISFEAKGGAVEKEVRALIYGLSAESAGDTLVLRMRLAAGNTNLRADRLASSILKRLNLQYQYMDITRKKLYNI